jgi:hypothetical protein
MTDLQIQAIIDAFVKAVDDLTKATSAATKQAATQKAATPQKAATQQPATPVKVQQNDPAKMSTAEAEWRLNPTEKTAKAYVKTLHDAAQRRADAAKQDAAKQDAASKNKDVAANKVDDPVLLESAKALLMSARASLDSKASTPTEGGTQAGGGTRAGGGTQAEEDAPLNRQEREQEVIANNTIGTASPFDAFKLGLEDSRLKLAKNSADMMLDIGQQLGDQLTNGLTTAWDAFISGSQSAGEAMANFARSTLSWLAQMITKYAMLQLVQAALKGASTMFSDGGSVAATPTPTSGAANGGLIQALAGGGRVVGWSPSKVADNIPALLTAREFVQPVRAVDHYGLRFMEAVRRLQFPRHIAHALAGGTIPAIPSGFRLAQGGMAAAALQTTVKAGDTKLKVVNVLHSNMMGDYMKSADGETVLLNMIRRNGSAIRTIIG